MSVGVNHFRGLSSPDLPRRPSGLRHCAGINGASGTKAGLRAPSCDWKKPRSASVALLALLAALLSAVAGAGLAIGAVTFPPLTGRVVDQANVLSAAEREKLTTRLADLEQKSGIQLVVATVSSLQGEEIEPYANQLFRTW